MTGGLLPPHRALFAGAIAGRHRLASSPLPRVAGFRFLSPVEIFNRRFPSLLSPPAVVTVATVFGVRHHCLRYLASPLPAYTVVTASSDNRCRCRHLQQPPSLLPAGAALRRPPSSSSVAHCSPQHPPLPSPAATAAADSRCLPLTRLLPLSLVDIVTFQVAAAWYYLGNSGHRAEVFYSLHRYHHGGLLGLSGLRAVFRLASHCCILACEPRL
ncbi:uncharacterized protein LOC122016601 isoform X1 [Zingiber officinale]|uniref:uncharacterized protein LOC122016601 isoform X1 n=1 Tax=Zingiber officinale TaxID=94328 RepID=UPI001C4BDD92|nr:uncharacterized protein LOC122016601 isoform X1 [Zingiber officinale]